MMRNIRIRFLIPLLLLASAAGAQEYKYYSPDASFELLVNTDNGFTWSLKYKGEQLILPSTFEIEYATMKIPGKEFRIKSFDTWMVADTLYPVVAHKDSQIPDRHNELRVEFRGGYTIQFRLYNDGIAYRLVTDFKQNMIVMNETSTINFLPGSTTYYPLETSFMSHNERTYIGAFLDTIGPEHLASLPLLVESGDMNILLTETALEKYPGMWVRGGGNGSLVSVFPGYPLEEKLYRDRDMRVVQTTDFIAETEGVKNYPWRVMVITDSDAALVESNLTWMLSDECRIEDPGWIKPGKVAWDWWNANNIYGVDFKSGINTETYKHYIDFASEYGIEYIILDEGWYRLGNLLDVTPGMDIRELCSYAASKNVGVILWVVWETLDRQLDQALSQFSQWGAKGIKVDFMQRDDQKMVEYYYKIARKAADYKLLVDFHGSYKPAGLRRTYPNVMTREGVKGLEHNKWSKDVTPKHDVTLPFIRMVAGPMDYTPGAMINLEPSNFNPMYTRPASQGTRVHQMALYVTFESPLQMLADNPSNYRREQECTRFIASVPTVWDETRVIDGKVGEFILIARRSGNDWFVSLLAGEKARTAEIDLSFLGSGSYRAEIFADGPNADRYAQDYTREERTITGAETLSVRSAPGGGWVARFTKE